MNKFDKDEFLKSALAAKWMTAADMWDAALRNHGESLFFAGVHDGIQTAVRQIYGVEFCFSRTADHYGLRREGTDDWLYRVDRKRDVTDEIREALDKAGYHADELLDDNRYSQFEMTDEGTVKFLFDARERHGYAVEVDPETGKSRHCGFGRGCFWTDWE